MLQRLLKAEGLPTGRLHVATLMKKTGDLPPSEYVEPAPGHKVLSPAQATRHPTQAGLGDGHHLHFDGAASSISPPSWTGSAAVFCRGGSGVAVHLRRLHGGAEEAEIAISMDGKGAWRDNVFVERLSIRYEEVYPHAYKSVPEARESAIRRTRNPRRVSLRAPRVRPSRRAGSG